MNKARPAILLPVVVIAAIIGLALNVHHRMGGQITAPATTGMIAPIARGAGTPGSILTCNAASAYLEFVNTLTSQVSYCDGTNWGMEVGTAGATGATGPTGPTGPSGVSYLTATTGTITGTLLAVGGSDTGTVTVTGAAVGNGCLANSATGANPSSSVWYHCEVTSANTVTLTETAFVLATPASVAFTVRVYP